MKYPFLLFSCLLLFPTANAQSIEKIVFDSADSTGYYLAVKPQSGKIQGVLVLFPGFAENAEAIFPETKLHNVGYVNDVLTIALSNGPKIYTDEKVIGKINLALSHVIKTYQVDPAKFVIGGYSAGGTIALRYTELTYETPERFPVKPAGVFTVDSPVDLIDLYHYFERELQRNFSQLGMNEARFIMGMMHKDLGELKTARENYVAHSPFTVDTPNGNERFLKNVPVRVYHDVDVEWKLKNRRRSMRDANEVQASEMVNSLLLMGNDRAEFMTGKTGYRSSGLRHPHSWSIVDEVELIQWMKKTLEFFPQYFKQQYGFTTPDTIFTEKEKFPLSFAPSISYTGIADIRFLPGFVDDKSEQFWSYCYLWHLDGVVKVDEIALQEILEKYYTGLSRFPSTAKVKKVKTTSGFTESFESTIHTFDDLASKKNIQLFAKIHSKSCAPDKTILFFQVSPAEYKRPVWTTLDQIRSTVNCPK